MDRGVGKPPFFDGTNYAYWKIRMSAYLQSLGASIWDICNSADYVVLAARVSQQQIDEHDANSRARNALFSCLSMSEFDRVSHLATAREIWATLMRFHEGTTQVKTVSTSRSSESMRTFDTCLARA